MKPSLAAEIEDQMGIDIPDAVRTFFESIHRIWAWSNSSILESLATVSSRVREYGDRHRIERFTNAKWEASEDDAWQMAALASLLFDQQGAYRGPAGDTFVFMTFGPVSIQKR